MLSVVYKHINAERKYSHHAVMTVAWPSFKRGEYGEVVYVPTLAIS